jgi:outer membrane immunogenic protein
MPNQFRWALSALTLVSLSLIAAPLVAHAADLPLKAPPPPPPPVFSWTGFYIGGNVGAGWTNADVRDSYNDFDFGRMNNNASFVGGGQVGYNWQYNWVVFGVEGWFDWMANNNNHSNGAFFHGDEFDLTANNRWVTTLTGRIGVTGGPAGVSGIFGSNWLFYAKGGAAWVGNNGFTVTNETTGGSLTAFGDNNNTQSGWTVGGGIEWAFANNWTVRAEYDFIGLEDRSFIVPANAIVLPAGDIITLHDRDIQMATIGVNWLFNSAPNNAVSTRY